MLRKNQEHGTRIWIDFKVQNLSKAGSALTLHVLSNGVVLGTMVIGKGTLSWYHSKSKKGRYLRWKAFDDLMQEHGHLPRSQ